jgi:hypothetical protein
MAKENVKANPKDAFFKNFLLHGIFMDVVEKIIFADLQSPPPSLRSCC